MNTPLRQGWKRIYLCRHGETDANAENRIQGGGVDLDLNHVGRKQAQALGEALSKFQIERVHSSTMKRSSNTARIMLDHLGPGVTGHDEHRGRWNVDE